jgi:hypothetical protein
MAERPDHGERDRADYGEYEDEELGADAGVSMPEIQTNRALQPTINQYMDGDRRICVLEVEWPLEGKRVVPLDFYFLKKVVAEIMGHETQRDIQRKGNTPQDNALIMVKRAAVEILHHEADEEAAADNEKTHGAVQAPKIIL